MMVRTCLLAGLSILGLVFSVQAQDTTKRRSIEITSTFKPVLRDAVKINFNALPPTVDTLRTKLSYDIPAQYLFLPYQPAPLQPVALRTDSAYGWKNDNYIKLGVGNVDLPYVQAGFSFGNGKSTFFNAFADEYASKGNLTYQKNNLTAVGLSGIVKTQHNLEWDGKLGFKSDGYFLYGYQPDTLKFSKAQVEQTFQTIDGTVGLRNPVPTEFGLTYNPSLHVAVFSDNHTPQAMETNSVLNLPLQKSFGNTFAFDLAFTANLTNYAFSNGQEKTIQNNLYYVSPALLYKTSNLNLQAELTPSWDQKQFHLLPNFLVDLSTNDKRLTFQAGWIGYYDKGSYQRFASINPWLAQPDQLLNTRVDEFYAGIKGSLTNHVTYSVKAGFNQYWNTPLFVNDSTDGKSFVIRYEPHMEAFQMHGEIAYTQSEQFSANVTLNINQYFDLQNQARAWGLLPVEFTTTLRWQLLKDLWLKGDLWAFEGAPFPGKNGNISSGTGGFDLNGGVEFRITRQLNLWLQMNNLLNDKYQRWNQYQVYGFNILGGIIFSFAQK